MLVQTPSAMPRTNKPPGVYYSFSDDLLNWTNATLLMADHHVR